MALVLIKNVFILAISDSIEPMTKVTNEFLTEKLNVIKQVDQEVIEIYIYGKMFKNNPLHFIKLSHLTPEKKKILL